MKRGIHLLAGMTLGALLATVGFAISSRGTTVQDPVKQSPQLYKVLLENDQVRVLEYRLKPGEKEPMHTHTVGLVYIFGDAKMRTTYPDGRSDETSGGGGGEAHWRVPVTHALQNIGNTEAHALAIDVKEIQKHMRWLLMSKILVSHSDNSMKIPGPQGMRFASITAEPARMNLNHE
jgi:beta-alanine degradation protein BauB